MQESNLSYRKFSAVITSHLLGSLETVIVIKEVCLAYLSKLLILEISSTTFVANDRTKNYFYATKYLRKSFSVYSLESRFTS